MHPSRRQDEQALPHAIDGRTSPDVAVDTARLLVEALRRTVADAEAPTPSAALASVLEHGFDDHESPDERRPVDAREPAGEPVGPPASSSRNGSHRSAALR